MPSEGNTGSLKPAPSATSWRVFESDSWDDFLERVKEAQKSLGFRKLEECFFRGHADSTWTLQPTLFRCAKDAGLTEQETLDLESALFWEFQARAQDLHHQT